MKMAGSPKQFGIDAGQAGASMRDALDRGFGLRGPRIVCGSQNLNAESIIEANALTLELASELCAETGTTLALS